VKKDRCSWPKRATKGSSFWDLENQLFERGLVAEGWKELQKKAFRPKIVTFYSNFEITYLYILCGFL